MICERCGATVAIGDWPFCPHGATSRPFAAQTDELWGGARWCEHLGHEPVWIETKTEFQRALDARGLQLRESGPHAAESRSPWATPTRRH